MPIHDLCTRNLVTISKDASAAEAAKRMKEERVGAIVVTDKSNNTVGIITDRDIVLGAVAEWKPMSIKVAELMSKDVLHVPREAGVADVIEKMEKWEVRRAVIVDKNNHACGIISADDLIQLIGNELKSLGNLVGRQISEEGMAKAV